MSSNQYPLPSSQTPWGRARQRSNWGGNAIILCVLKSQFQWEDQDIYASPEGAVRSTPNQQYLLLLLVGFTHDSSWPSMAEAWMLYWPGCNLGGPCLVATDDDMLQTQDCQVDENGMVTLPDQLWFLNDNQGSAIGFTSMKTGKQLQQSSFTGELGVNMKPSTSTDQIYDTFQPLFFFEPSNPNLFQTVLGGQPLGNLNPAGAFNQYNTQKWDFDPRQDGIIELNNQDLSNTNFSDAALNYISFKNCALNGASFNGAQFLNIDFSGATFANNDFTNCDLSKVTFDATASLSKARAILHGATFPFSLIQYLQWDGLDFGNATVLGLEQQLSSQSAPLSAKGANLQGLFKDTPGLILIHANFTGANLLDNDLTKADLTGATLDDCQLQGANLEGATIVDVSMKGARLDTEDGAEAHTSLEGALLEEATLDGVHLRNAYMSGIQFYGSYNTANSIDLTNVDLTNANLSQIDLSATSLSNGTHLDNAKLDNANLIQAKLNYAYLTSASLSGTFLQGADFTNAVISAVNLMSASVCLADSDSAVLGVPLFTIDSAVTLQSSCRFLAKLASLFSVFSAIANSQKKKGAIASPTQLIAALDKGDIAGANLQTVFTNKSQNWQNLGTPTLTTSIEGQRWILQAGAAIYNNVQNNKMPGQSDYLSYTLELHNGEVFVLGRDFWCTAIVVSTTGTAQSQQKAVYLQGSKPPQGVTPGAYDITGVGATLLPSPLDGSIYCPNGQTVAENQSANTDQWLWMIAPVPPAPPKCVPNPAKNHYCPHS